MTLPATPSFARLALLQLLILLTLSVNGSWRKTVRLELEPGVVAQTLAAENHIVVAIPAPAAVALLVMAVFAARRRRAASRPAPTRCITTTRPLRITHRPPGQAPPGRCR